MRHLIKLFKIEIEVVPEADNRRTETSGRMHLHEGIISVKVFSSSGLKSFGVLMYNLATSSLTHVFDAPC